MSPSEDLKRWLYIFCFSLCLFAYQKFILRLKGEGMHVYLWLTHIAIWQTPAQHCKAIILYTHSLLGAVDCSQGLVNIQASI